MKTIILFHRLELTDLFVPVGRALEGRIRVVHLAYGAEEVARLRELGVSEPVTVFKDEIRRLHEQTSADAATLAEIDRLFVQYSDGAFNLNGAIQSDRGFVHLSLDEAYRLTATYHAFWKGFLERHDAAMVLHETCSLMFNFVAAMLCAERGGHYLYAIMALAPDKRPHHLLMSGFDFTCPDLDRRLDEVERGERLVDEAACVAYLDGFRKNFSVFLSGLFKKPSLVRMIAAAIKEQLRARVRPNRHDRVLENIDYWRDALRTATTRLQNVVRYRREVKFDRFDPKEKFYFYPLHLEPEAVVLYHSYGLYRNQIKLVQNVAAQLPPGVLLYVKDHPHDQGYRSADDYLALKSVPNIRLIDNVVSGKEITFHSLGVITLVGTAGFEAMLLGKPVFTFAKTFYSRGPGVVRVPHIRDLREALYALEPPGADAEVRLHRFLTAYFAALHPGLTDFFAGRAGRYGVDLDQNAILFAEGLLATIEAEG